MDNCRVHHSIKVQQFILEHKLHVIFNVAYGPEFNPIERVWAQLKLVFKKRRLTLILEGRVPNYEKIIRNILHTYPKEKIRSICEGTMMSKLVK